MSLLTADTWNSVREISAAHLGRFPVKLETPANDNRAHSLGMQVILMLLKENEIPLWQMLTFCQDHRGLQKGSEDV